MPDVGVLEAVEGLQALIAADGGAFELLGFNPADGVVHLRLVMDKVTCEECILPPDMLRQVATDFMRRSVSAVSAVEVVDPREVTGQDVNLDR